MSIIYEKLRSYLKMSLCKCPLCILLLTCKTYASIAYVVVFTRVSHTSRGIGRSGNGVCRM